MIKMPRYKYYFALYDLMILSISFGLSYALILPITAMKLNTGVIFPSVLLFAALSCLIIYSFEKNNLYKINVIMKRKLHLTSLLKSLAFASLVTFIVFFAFFRYSLTSLSLIILSFVFSSSLLFSFMRIGLYRRMILKKRTHNFFRKNILIIGAGKSGRNMAENLYSENPFGINIIGFLDDYIPYGTEVIPGKKILGKINNIRSLSSKYYLDEAVISIDKINYERLLEIIDEFREVNIGVKLSSTQVEVISKKFSREKYGSISVLDVTPSRKSAIIIIIKRWIDIYGSLAGLILLLPLLLVIIVLIKLTSPGPILFKQIRIGFNGKPFTFYKFRSMYVLNGEDNERKNKMLEFMNGGLSDAKETKVINDKRVTWIGKFIRKTSLDELPQLINVLKGDMSLVGPRPCLPYEYENYKRWQKRRVNVVPGCTGVWQVSGRSSVSFNDSILLDLYYINNLSLWFDMRILLMTLPVMFFSKGGK